MPLYIAQSRDLDRCHGCLRTDSLTTLKERATQLLIRYKSGALVTQFFMRLFKSSTALFGKLWKIATLENYFSVD